MSVVLPKVTSRKENDMGSQPKSLSKKVVSSPNPEAKGLYLIWPLIAGFFRVRNSKESNESFT